MRLYKVITLLLTYPEQHWLQSVGELRAILSTETGRSRRAGRRLDGLFTHLQRGTLIDLQATYVETFDRNAAHSLHVFEHTMGDSRERGEAMARQVEEYRRFGLEPTSRELPDFLPLFLEFLSLIPPEEAQGRLAAIEDVVESLHNRLAAVCSPYAGAFDALTAMIPGSVLSGTSSPIRSMKRFLRRKQSGIRMGVQGTFTKEPLGGDRHRET
ncbi:MAG: nitrate reductase molybdenum cofactor assembly chaperone [Nitrospira sp.]|nr:nitrate reductase molybdenum cofactor assembly chaperone [Nitrospira sp.]